MQLVLSKRITQVVHVASCLPSPCNESMGLHLFSMHHQPFQPCAYTYSGPMRYWWCPWSSCLGTTVMPRRRPSTSATLR